MASTIDVAGTHTISAPVTLNNDATISGTGILNFTGGISGNYALTVTSGTLNASSIGVDTLAIGGSTSQAVPEPSAQGLLLVTGILFFWHHSRRRLS